MAFVQQDQKLDFKDVLIRPKQTSVKSRAEIDLICEHEFRTSKWTYKGIPIMASNMDSVGTLDMARTLVKSSLFTCACRHISLEEWVKLRTEFGPNGTVNGTNIWSNVGITTAINDKDFNITKKIIEAVPELKFVFLDVANGYMESFVDFVRKARETWPEHTIVAGNVATPEMVEELLLAGADIVKVGIGPGSVCTTRKMTGVGYPQLSAVLECGKAAHELGGHIIADGGCTSPGDIAKAFAAGADFVMVGGLLAGHDQTSGEVIEKNGRKYKLFYGMASKMSMEKYSGEVPAYLAIEGTCVEIPYRGDINRTIQDILGGIRSCCSYTGARRLQDLRNKATFVRVTHQSNDVFAPLVTYGYDY